MRRAQSVRHYGRPSIALTSDDLGVLKEPGESDEDVLRRQLLEKDRQVDQLTAQVDQLKLQLSQRPPLEEIQALTKEYKNLDLLLQGTQRENERCMAELEKVKAREKLLEKKLCDLAGENWQSTLDIPPASGAMAIGSRSGILGHQRTGTALSGSPIAVSTLSGMYSHSRAGSGSSSSSPSAFTHPHQQHQQQDQSQSDDHAHDHTADLSTLQLQQQEALAQKLEQIKLLVLGMDQRLQTREGTLAKKLEVAEGNTKKLEALKRELPVAISV
ncbi:hypothetical protein CC2G_000137 [Coprinopsis cinerea AmutBmut pab1-1]|nr:hypothetical protein CC2G_000137 [Coprinopsis cinerea AmutBmut pab1-1]